MPIFVAWFSMNFSYFVTYIVNVMFDDDDDIILPSFLHHSKSERFKNKYQWIVVSDPQSIKNKNQIIHVIKN